ncbi:MAG: hypothetical protein DWQ34_01575 [Planctomycetota bacterium]|nr:MAG: hypothetical protein DWQ29_14790 [Planctomycetota bacterium]REJ97761.1 MAG: hypothetical protein DWQ34_01575 [Planctomycetota bacterium]REK25393.1 MAG: hypothetical protein DWQ41_12190 [Planctomycetota bacterium]REK35716.1 MAG: hypothetical protein DWQ45_11250 [Planctomycetota bacterium]
MNDQECLVGWKSGQEELIMSREKSMLSEDAQAVAEKAKRIYEAELRERLESSDHGRFVCIEPESGDFFLGDSLDRAVNQAIDAHPDRLTHTLRIGHSAALHIGVADR